MIEEAEVVVEVELLQLVGQVAMVIRMRKMAMMMMHSMNWPIQIVSGNQSFDSYTAVGDPSWLERQRPINNADTWKLVGKKDSSIPLF